MSSMELQSELARLARHLDLAGPNRARRQALDELEALLDGATGGHQGIGHPYRGLLGAGEATKEASAIGGAVVDWLGEILRSDMVELRSRAAKLLGRLGLDRAIPALFRALSDPEGEVRRSAAEALTRLGDPVWARLVRGDDRDLLRIARSGDPRAAEVLLDAVRRPEWEVRVWAIEGFEVLGIPEEIVRVLSDADPHVADRAEQALVRMGREGRAGVEVLAALLWGLFQDDPAIRGGAARVLGGRGDLRAVTPLIGALDDDFWKVRAAAAQALGDLRDRRALDALSRARVDPVSEVWVAAREALSRLGLEPTLEPLVAALRHPDWGVRLTAIDVLAGHSDSRAVAALGGVLHDPQTAVGRHALGRLIDRRDRLVFEVISSSMRLGEPQVRQSIGQALASLREPEALEALIDGLRGGKAADVIWVVEPLASCDERWIALRLIEALSDRDRRVSRFAFAVLERMGGSADAPLLAALEIGDAGEQAEAFELMQQRIARDTDVTSSQGYQRTRKTVPMLIGLLDTEDQVLRARVELLIRQSSFFAVDPLIESLRDRRPQVRALAARLLGELYAVRAIEPLECALEDPNRAVREQALAALVAMGRRRR
jgi:HEAT repeat protein